MATKKKSTTKKTTKRFLTDVENKKLRKLHQSLLGYISQLVGNERINAETKTKLRSIQSDVKNATNKIAHLSLMSQTWNKK